ncbi:hypothetical protein GCM10028801_45530 [Nocardioides maradonensis]
MSAEPLELGRTLGEDQMAAYALAAGVSIGPGNVALSDPRPGPPQAGWWDRRLLLQYHRWTDVTGRSHQLRHMSVMYRENVAAFVELHAVDMVARATGLLAAGALDPAVPATELARQMELLRLLRGRWVRGTPLVAGLLFLNEQASQRVRGRLNPRGSLEPVREFDAFMQRLRRDASESSNDAAGLCDATFPANEGGS